jgi:hypothetical protein
MLMLAPLVLLTVALTSCGGGGSATPQGVGDAVLSAVKGEDFPSVYDSFAPWTTDAHQVRKDQMKFESETTKDWWKNHKDTYSSGGDNSLDPGKKLEIDSEEKLFELDPNQGAALMQRWYQKAHKWEKFKERMEDLRLVDVSTKHGLEGDGSATVTYQNRYGDELSVGCERIGGVWYARSTSLKGEEKLPTKE